MPIRAAESLRELWVGDEIPPRVTFWDDLNGGAFLQLISDLAAKVFVDCSSNPRLGRILAKVVITEGVGLLPENQVVDNSDLARIEEKVDLLP
jgi:hypothetical protein